MVTVLPAEALSSFALPFRALLQKRLFFFTGKGGVGKTTVASAFALFLARQGKRTLLIEFDQKTRAARLLGATPAAVSSAAPREVLPSLFVLSTTGEAALEEYLGLIIPVKRLLRNIVESRAYQYFVAAAPGLKELLAVGKVWYEERKKDSTTQQLLWDALVIDLPATGHGLQYLGMPRAARDTFGEGILSREAERIFALVRDPAKTAINLVTTLDELPVSELHDAYSRLTETLELTPSTLFINGVRRIPPWGKLLPRIQIPRKLSTSDRQFVEGVLSAARTEVLLAQAQEALCAQLQPLSLPTVVLPFVLSPTFGIAEVESLSYALKEVLEDHSGAARNKRKPRRKASSLEQ